MYIQAILVCCLTIVHPILCYDKMDPNDNPILEYLEMEPNSVAEHELVKINLSERLHKRGIRAGRVMTFEAFGINLDLWLRPGKSTIASDATPVYKAQSSESERHGVKYTKVPNAFQGISQILEDSKHLASVILDTDDSGRETVTGYLHSPYDHSRLVIRSLPANVVKGYLRKRRSIDEFNDDSMDSMYHVVLKLKNNDVKHHSIENFSHPSMANSGNWQDGILSDYKNINNKKPPSTVYPEILIEMDATLRENFTPDKLKEQLKYALVFWNTVDLLYRQIYVPMFKLNIAGIIIAETLSATPFIANNRQRNRDFLDESKALVDSAQFHEDIEDIFPLDSYDIVVTMTKFYMGRSLERQVLGVSSFNGACKYGRISLLHDDGAFSTILTAAHELGHLFGLEDETKNPPPGKCPSGYIMSGSIMAKRTASIFSRCSLEAFKRNHQAGNYSCMYNEPKIAGKQWVLPLPGRENILVDACLAFNGQPPCDRLNDNICMNYLCQRPRGGCIERGIGAPPGTPCINEQQKPSVCVANRCMPSD